jgi:putative ATPase
MLIFFQTTLAHIIANQCKKDNQEARFVTMSATMSGVNDVKDAVKIAKNELKSFKRRTILFMDEIHRFNKLQQVIIDTLFIILPAQIVGNYL